MCDTKVFTYKNGDGSYEVYVGDEKDQFLCGSFVYAAGPDLLAFRPTVVSFGFAAKVLRLLAYKLDEINGA